MFKIKLKSQNLSMTFPNTVAVFYTHGSIFTNFGPCYHILPTGWIYVLHKPEKEEVIDAFLHIEGILSGHQNVLTLYSGRILQSMDGLNNKLQDMLITNEWKSFLKNRMIAADNKGWFKGKV